MDPARVAHYVAHMTSGGLVTEDVGAAFAAFFRGGEGPRHSTISSALTGAGYGDSYEYDPTGQGPNKEQRVLAAFRRARAEPGNGRRLVESLLSALRTEQLIGQVGSPRSADEARLREALGRSGWYLDEDGLLRAFSGVDVDTGGREALEENLRRLRASTGDPALLIGTAKDLLEAVAKFALEETGMPVEAAMSFDQLWHIARERLGMLPERVDKTIPGFEAIREIHQSSWSIARNVNALRNLQGTGHGRTLPTGVTEDLALLVVREAGSVAEYMLRQLDRLRGR